MEDIQRQVEDILESKGVPPPTMTNEEFMERVFNEFNQKIPELLQSTVTQISRNIMKEEMKRIGRGQICRHISEKSGKHCNQPPDCYQCPNYKPSPRWQQWLWLLVQRSELYEPLLVCVFTLSFLAAVFAKDIRLITVCLWFGLILISRANIFVLTRRLHKYWDKYGVL